MALVVTGRLALLQSDYELAKVFFEKGYALLQDEADPRSNAWALANPAQVENDPARKQARARDDVTDVFAHSIKHCYHDHAPYMWLYCCMISSATKAVHPV